MWFTPVTRITGTSGAAKLTFPQRRIWSARGQQLLVATFLDHMSLA
jgi:hypothetical protein